MSYSEKYLLFCHFYALPYSLIPFIIDIMTMIKTIDAKGLSCPLPLLKAKQGLYQIKTGERLCVLSTDAGSVRDFHAFIDFSVHHMIEFTEVDDHYCYVIEKG